MYSDFYGLAGRPFQLTPDPAFYFESVSHRQALSYLGYGLAQAEGFVVITGEVGAGKSTLVAYLMATIDRSRLTAAQVVSGHLERDDIIQVFARAFGLPTTNRKPAALDAIEIFLHDEARAGRRCLLVVDEAQHLPIATLEELRLLSNFQLGAHPLLQILLLGQPEFRSRLQCHPELEQLRQRVIASHHLDPLEAGEVERYIHHRLKCVGWNGNPSFDPSIFAELHSASDGVPRRINQIVNRLLLRGAVEQKRHVDGAILARVLAELNGDGDSPAANRGMPALPARAQGADDAPDQPRAEPGPPAPTAVLSAIPHTHPEDALAGRDPQIAELQQAMHELAEAAAGGRAAHQCQHTAALHERLASLENRVIEQERTIRHTLIMLIEWIERDDTHYVAA